ncbi:MAG: hypothetical protein US58_C0014G0020 [Candidatus Magasanikbacteria bacterium GW2011_GWA2_37_8]|uniref:Methyltransferase type 11 domain-containing protein n=1 Tax=Candidatus Magasanikbacteria bacterium GW2011_GWA2_37_8 TaxID=1619036 RepID=A0A0G0HBT8_9BACT|nr:MAG: hypothetical protein US58_C0014G0020 [Candidatus Magasanikbacteria bacterium GW2011_GWA2_37_8]
MNKNFLPFKVLIKGLITFIPGTYKLFCRGTGGTTSARYCYSVWLRHMVLAKKNNISIIPRVVAEIGPGDSIGIGLSALLSGSDKYFALDAFKHINNYRNIEIFDELIELFKNKEKIPDDNEFPNILPKLDNYNFPDYILSDDILDKSLDPERLGVIKEELINSSVNGNFINYFAPWHSSAVIKENSVDFIYSQFVLEHVNDLELTYKAMNHWLKPKGFMSHMIDFRCHGTARVNNGHWGYSNFIWKLIVGGRPFLINRQPLSSHIFYLNKFGFKILNSIKYQSDQGISREQLSSEFFNLDDDDLKTWGVFIQIEKV